MEISQQILFAAVLFSAIYFFSKRMSMIKQLIFMGQHEIIDDQPLQRWKNVFFLALGQRDV